jgi:hypothetical protein
MCLSAVSGLWVLWQFRGQPPPAGLRITVLIMLLQPLPLLVTFFALGRPAARSHLGIAART